MRCSDVIQELAAPSGDLDRGELRRHLTSCPDCAAWKANAERLDRAWAATRPAEPGDSDFEQVWARVIQAEATAPAPTPRQRTLPLWGVMAAGLALAAAVLLALFPINGPKDGVAPGISQVATTSPVEPIIEVEAGQVLFIHVNGDQVAIVRRDRPGDEEMAVASADVAADFELWVRSGAL
jgi:hypothetical protein